MSAFSRIAFIAIISVSGPAFASSIAFEGQNPAIFQSANPGGNAALMASVNKPKDPNQSLSGQLSPATIVEQAVLSQISAQINDQIFNGGQPAGGPFDLGGGSTISYVRQGGNLVITLFDPQHGQTVITLPDL